MKVGMVRISQNGKRQEWSMVEMPCDNVRPWSHWMAFHFNATVPFGSIQQSHITELLALPNFHRGHGHFGQVPNSFERRKKGLKGPKMA